MNFADRMNEQAQAQDMSEKKVTAEEFEDAIKQATEEIIKDPEIEGIAKLFIPLVGTAFTRHVRKILFGEEK